MTIEGSVARAREKVLRMLRSECTVFSTGEQITDPNTGEVTRAQTVVYTGPCKVRPAATGLTALSDDIGGGELFRFDYRVSLPFEVDTVFEGHRLTITSSPDPALLGITLEVQRVDRGDSVTARRLICQRIA